MSSPLSRFFVDLSNEGAGTLIKVENIALDSVEW